MKLKESIESVRKTFRADSDPFPKDIRSIEALRVKYLGRKGLLASLFSSMKDISDKERPLAGSLLNELKQEINSVFSVNKESSELNQVAHDESDYTLPGLKFPVGYIHPVQQTLDEVKSIFMNVGFSVVYGPEIDDDFENKKIPVDEIVCQKYSRVISTYYKKGSEYSLRVLLWKEDPECLEVDEKTHGSMFTKTVESSLCLEESVDDSSRNRSKDNDTNEVKKSRQSSKAIKE